MSTYFERYNLFLNGQSIPFIEITKRPSDKYKTFKEGATTYDSLSYKYYGNSLMGWIISLGNPEYVDEFQIESGKVIRIPFPLDSVQQELQNKISQYNSL